MAIRGAGVLVVAVALLSATACGATSESDPTALAKLSGATPSAASSRASQALAGKHIVIDPGHQLGNQNFPAQINRLVPAGVGQRKACNSTGTATQPRPTQGVVAEATIAFQVSRQLANQLRDLGAKVVLTRTRNSAELWGPCVNVRGQWDNGVADFKLSVHADGSFASNARGFHVISPRAGADTSAKLAERSLRCARLHKNHLIGRGLNAANYVAGGAGIDIRGDLATLNLATQPVLLVELGNLKDRRDAALLTSSAGQEKVVSALTSALTECVS